jgi:6-pyruvoyl-tetrahydropterin synthase
MAQTLFLRDFTALDFACLDEVAGLQGESLYVSAELEGELDEEGFILDFGPAKKILKQVVDSALDHKLVVPALHPLLQGTLRGLSFGGLQYEAPAEAVALLEGKAITIPLLERFLAEAAQPLLPANVAAVRFQLRTDPRFIQEPHFRYTHGLRLHKGNCQRLLHGHRNPVEVRIGGERSRKWEEFLAREWDGAHFVYAPTLENRDSLDLPLGRRVPAHGGFGCIAYSAPQGAFRATLPASRLILLETEPSIENIAGLGAGRIRQAGERAEAIQVVAFEGLNKGAVFTSRPAGESASAAPGSTGG